MNIKSNRIVLTLFLIINVVSIPSVGLAYQNLNQVETNNATTQDESNEILQAKAAGEQDASKDFNQPIWCIVGGAGVTLGGGFGLIAGLGIGMIIDPPEGCELISSGMVLGCIGGYAMGVAAPLYMIYNYDPFIPSTRLLGKSPTYIQSYTDAYKQKARWLRTSNAVGGWVVLTGVFTVANILSY